MSEQPANQDPAAAVPGQGSHQEVPDAAGKQHQRDLRDRQAQDPERLRDAVPGHAGRDVPRNHSAQAVHRHRPAVRRVEGHAGRLLRQGAEQEEVRDLVQVFVREDAGKHPEVPQKQGEQKGHPNQAPRARGHALAGQFQHAIS